MVVVTIKGPFLGSLCLLAPCLTSLVRQNVRTVQLVLLSRWAFPKIGDPNIVPQIEGSLVQGPQNKVPLVFGNSHII